MGKRVQDTKPAPAADNWKWVVENVAEQKKRYADDRQGTGGTGPPA